MLTGWVEALLALPGYTTDRMRTSISVVYFNQLEASMPLLPYGILFEILKDTQAYTLIILQSVWIRVISQAGLFKSGLGRVRACDVLFFLGAQKYNQNNLATLLNFSDLT